MCTGIPSGCLGEGLVICGPDVHRFVRKQSLLETQEWNSNKLKLPCPKTEADGKWLHFCEDTGTGKAFIDTVSLTSSAR